MHFRKVGSQLLLLLLLLAFGLPWQRRLATPSVGCLNI